MSFQTRPFAFDRIFAMPQAAAETESATQDHAPALATLRAEIDLLKHHLETARTVARVEGFEAGLAQAREETAAALLAATDALHVTLEAVETEYAAIEGRLSKAAAGLAMAAAEGLAARELTIDPAFAIDEAIGRVLLQVARGQELQVRVNPVVFERMNELIAARQAGERRRLSLIVVADARIAVGDVSITWEQGGLVLDAAARRAAILAELGLSGSDLTMTPMCTA